MKPSTMERSTTPQSRGTAPPKPTPITRCRSKIITIPKGEGAFKKKIKKWISGCVLSRTKRGDGTPWKREDVLVDNNKSLREVWGKVSHLTGKKISIFATYHWRKFGKDSWGVDSITFYVSGMVDPIINIPPPPRYYDYLEEFVPEASIKDLARRQREVLTNWVREEKYNVWPKWARRMQCVLFSIEDHGHNVDDFFLSKRRVKDNLSKITPDFPKSPKDLGLFSSTIREELWVISDSSTRNSFVMGLKRIDKDIEDCIDFLVNVKDSGGSGSTSNAGMRYLFKFVAGKLQTKSSIYYCYSQ